LCIVRDPALAAELPLYEPMEAPIEPLPEIDPALLPMTPEEEALPAETFTPFNVADSLQGPEEVAEYLKAFVEMDPTHDTAPGYIIPGQVLRAAEKPRDGVKACNPKDAVGIRKAPLSVVPMNVIAEIGVGMLEGAAKYGRHNYRAVGTRASVLFDATLRHLIAWWEGEDVDPDTCPCDEDGNLDLTNGLSHITKALTSLVVLRDGMLQGRCTDDRPPRSPRFYPALNARAAETLDKHADKAPHHYTINDQGKP
jgi:hypothetical protein